jgi:hypothetical protein
MKNMTLRKSLLLVTLAGCAVDASDPDQAIEQIEQIDEIDELDGSEIDATNDTSGPVGSLFDLTLSASRSPLASVINGSRVASIAEGRFENKTAQALTLSVHFTAPAMTFASHIVDDFVAIGPGRKAFPCGGPEERCELQAPSDPADRKVSGALTGAWKTFVIDEATGEVVCSGSENLACPLPGTADPRAYRVIAGITGMHELAASAASMETQMLGGKAFIGALGETFDVCTRQREIIGAQGLHYYQCMASTRYARFQALAKAQVTIAPATLELEAASGATVQTSSFVMEALGWNAGEAELPGRE